jgi:hypothetical protein
VLRQVGLHSLALQPTDLVFDDWWEKATAATVAMSKKRTEFTYNIRGMGNLESS